MRKAAASDFFLHRLAIPRLVAAGSLLAIGAVHLQQYIVRDYRVIPTIGPLFLLNFIAGTVLGLYFLVPARARVSRVRLLADTAAALSGVGVAAGGLVALIVSEHTLLFGFMEHGYRFAIVFTIASEVVAILALGIFLALSLTATRKRDSGRPSPAAPATIAPVTES
jgi:hypothetical protein